jgi:hypothetical protein
LTALTLFVQKLQNLKFIYIVFPTVGSFSQASQESSVEHVGKLDFGMMISFIIGDDFAADCFLWAPTVTCKTSLAMMLPNRFLIHYLNVIDGTNS